MASLGRFLLIVGLSLAALGAVLLVAERGGWRLPGDLVFRGKNWAFYLPLGTSLLLSAVLTLLVWLFSRR